MGSSASTDSLIVRVGGRPLLDRLLADATLTANAKAKQGLNEMVILFTFLEAYKITDKVASFFSVTLHENTD